MSLKTSSKIVYEYYLNNNLNTSNVSSISNINFKNNELIKIAFVGDSLGLQYEQNLKCMHAYYIINGFHIQYLFDHFLYDEKLNQSIFYQPTLATSDIIVLNTGAWYTEKHFNDTADEAYKRTILFVDDQLSLIKETFPDKIIIWSALPYVYYSSLGGASRSWLWDSFSNRNNYAFNTLKNIDLFLDPVHATSQRKKIQPQWSTDGLHWCNPFKSGQNTFLNEAMFHLIAKILLE
jgi:hypothetical protein